MDVTFNTLMTRSSEIRFWKWREQLENAVDIKVGRLEPLGINEQHNQNEDLRSR